MQRISPLPFLFLVTAARVFAWWDTQIMVLRDPPLVAEVEAERVVQGAAVVDDVPQFGPEAGGRWQ